MKYQDIAELFYLCKLLGIKTTDELQKFKDRVKRKYNKFTNNDFLAELEKSAML